MDAKVRKTKRTEADGEVVWFRYLDADIKPADDARASRWRRRQESPIAGKSTKQPLKPLRGECRAFPA
jgi:hypothetical protein